MSRAGDKNANWKGGRVRGGHGRNYWLVYAPDHPRAQGHGYVLEHRIVAEKTLGRYLRPDETVHHINGDSLDNHPENLAVMTQSEHARLHDGLRGHRYVSPPAKREWRECEQCGGEFEAVGKKESSKRFCSRDCYLTYRRATGGLLKKGVAA